MFTWVRNHPIVSFFSLTYFFLMLGWVIFNGQVPFGPLLAALILLPMLNGREGLREWAKGLFHWRVEWRWYAAAIILPFLVTATAAGLNILLGAEARPIQWSTLPELPFEAFFVFLFVGLGEEPGFRGFALPRLQARYSALVATLILGILGVIWHIPLFLSGDSPWDNMPLIVVGYFVFTWLFNNTNGSVLIVMLFHTATAIYGPLVFAPIFEGADLTSYTWLLTLSYALVVGVVMFTSGVTRLSSKPLDQLTNIATPIAV